MIAIRPIDPAHGADIRLKNEPFPLFGRLVLSLDNGIWSCRTHLFPPEEITEMCFPDEPYDFAAMGNCLCYGAYDGDTCVGLAILQNGLFRYRYLEDLKVCRAYRRQGVAGALIDAAAADAKAAGLRGLYAVGQDNNLAACRFYLKNGFLIGGFNNRDYTGTAQEGKADIYFYLDV